MVDNPERRTFLQSVGAALGAGLAVAGLPGAAAGASSTRTLQVWSCGGLAEAMVPANALFNEKNSCDIAYTGAFAGALGKSLLGGTAQTEVFAPRVLELARKLKAQGKMIDFQPLCFTRYVVITPKGNPAGIGRIEDLGRNGLKPIIVPEASPPGGQASMVILKKAGVHDQVVKNAVARGDCVQTAVPEVIDGQADAAVVEYRVTRLPQFRGKLDIIDIPEKYYPPAPLTFTVGRMKWAMDVELAEEYVRFIVSEAGQKFFEDAGYIPARSELGLRLTQHHGVRDA